MDEEKVILYPESFFKDLKKGSEEYLKSKAICRKIEKDFNESFDPEIKISAKVKKNLLFYEVINQHEITIDSRIPNYIKDHFCLRKDISFNDLLSEREKEVIRNFQTKEGETASELDLIWYVSKDVEGLYIDKQRGLETPKGQAACRYYFATRRAEECGQKCVKEPEYYKKLIANYEQSCKAIPYDFYKSRPKTEYWQLVWDALEYCYFSIFTSEKVLKERALCNELNLQPLDQRLFDSREWCTPDAFLKLKDEIIREASRKRIDETVYCVETTEELLDRIEWDFLKTILEHDKQIRQRLNYYKTFFMAFYLKVKHRQVYDHYLERARKILRKLKRIKTDDEFEENEYLDLKARLGGDLLFACIFHDYIRGGKRYLKICRKKGRPKEEHIKEALDSVKVWIPLLKEFGVKNYLDRGVELLNALAEKEVYSLKPIKRGHTCMYDKGRRLGLKYRGSRVLQEELKRLTHN